MDDHDAQAKQVTPTGVEIPIPTRDAVLRDLAKLAQPKPDPKPEQDSERS